MGENPDGPSKYHHGDLRRALIERAIEVISEQGVEAVNLRAMARDLGVSHGAPARHFATRADLLSAVANFGAESLLEATTNLDAHKTDDKVKLLAAVSRSFVKWAAANPAFHRILSNPSVMQYADKTLMERMSSIGRAHQGLVKKAQEDGWRSDERTEKVFLEIIAMSSGLALISTDPMYQLIFGRPLNSEAIEDALRKVFET